MAKFKDLQADAIARTQRGYLVLKNKINLPILVIFAAFIVSLLYFFSYLFPFTDDAFVVTNVTPVAADVSGFITHIYVKNGDRVKKGQPVFQVYEVPYQLAYQQALAEYHANTNHIMVLEKKANQTHAELKSAQAELGKINYELELKRKHSVYEAVSTLEIKKLEYDVGILTHRCLALEQKIQVFMAEIKEQHQIVKHFKAKKNAAKINLDLTTVRAPGDGIIDNMYVSLSTPIKIHEPIFSFIDTSNYYVQANFDETDLRHVRSGDKAYIITRMYYFTKVFHGEIVNSLWAAERQVTARKSQVQIVTNENEWLLLPQRFPLQIKIADPDKNFPLHFGASAYVYIETHR